MNTWSCRTCHLIWPGSDLIYHIYAIYIVPWITSITLNENEIDDWSDHHLHAQLSNCWKLLHCERLIMARASSPGPGFLILFAPGPGFATLAAIIFDKMDQYGRKIADCTKPEFDVMFIILFLCDLGLCYGKNWNSFWKYMSGKVCTIHTPLWTTLAVGACLKVRTS